MAKKTSEELLLQSLTSALRKLGQAGYAHDANVLAAKTWSALRHENPDMAERLNGTMHYLSRLPDSVDAPRNHSLKSQHQKPIPTTKGSTK